MKRGSLYFLFFHFKSLRSVSRVPLTLRLKHIILPAILFRLFFADQRIIINIKNKHSNLKSYNEIESGRNERYILYANSKKAKEILNWKGEKNLKDSIKSAYEWEKKLQKIKKF